MSKYAKKILVAAIVIIAIAMLVAIKSIGTAVLVLMLGTVIVLYLHVSRCRFCESWETAIVTERVPAGNLSAADEIVLVKRHCFQCETDELLERVSEGVWEQDKLPPENL